MGRVEGGEGYGEGGGRENKGLEDVFSRILSFSFCGRNELHSI